MYKEPIKINNDYARYEALKAHQNKYVKNNETCKDPSVFSIGSTVAVQCKDGGPWMHKVIEEVNGSDHRGQSYVI